MTEGIFSYCGVKVKIDTDRHLGPEQAAIRCGAEMVGHVTTAEYGSQMLSIGGVRHLTGGSKKEGNVTCDTLLKLCSGEAVELTIDGGHTVMVQAGKAPVVDGREEERMRVGCGSATVGIFAKQWQGHVDEVIVVDDHITGVLTEHQAGRCLDMAPAGIRVRGRKSTPGRYFQVANPGLGWGGTDITEPLALIQKIDPKVAWPGLRLLFTSTTGEDALYCVLDENLQPVPAEMPAVVRAVVDRIGENCEPSLCTVMFMAGAGGSLRAGVTENPVLLTRSVQSGQTTVTMGGAPAYLWPGGGITVMVDVMRLPKNAFGYVPTPAIVAPLEFTLPRALYLATGGHAEEIVSVEDVVKTYRGEARVEPWDDGNPWPLGSGQGSEMLAKKYQAGMLPGNRLHLSEGPIDLVIWADGEPEAVAEAYRAAEQRFDGLLARTGRRAAAAAHAAREWRFRRFKARSRGAWRRPAGRIAPCSSRRWPPLRVLWRRLCSQR